MVLVFSFMLVIVLMGEARKPQNWRWMFAGQGDQALTDAEIAHDDIDTRLRPDGTADSAASGPIALSCSSTIASNRAFQVRTERAVSRQRELAGPVGAINATTSSGAIVAICRP